MNAVGLATGILLVRMLAAAEFPSPELERRVDHLLRTERFFDAERVISDQLRATPKWEKGHLILAQIYTQKAQYDAAERSASAALRIRQSVDGLLLLAVAEMRLNRLNDAVSSLEQAARLQPAHAEIYNVLGTVYTLGAWMLEAEKAFAQAVRLAPSNWEYRYAYGRTLFELRRFEDALRELSRAVELNTTSVKAWTALGQAQERSEKNQDAENSYRKALELCAGAECSWPLLQLGYRYASESKMAQALPYYHKAVQARPNWALPHFHLGKTLAALNDLNAARAEIETAITLDSNKPDFHYLLAQIYRRLGETEKSNAQFARFRSLKQQEGTTAELGPPER